MEKSNLTMAYRIDRVRGCEKFVIRKLVRMNTIDATGVSKET